MVPGTTVQWERTKSLAGVLRRSGEQALGASEQAIERRSAADSQRRIA
jgi:hypothetical protein